MPRARAHHEPAKVEPPPNPRVLVALSRWQRKLTLTVPHAMLDDDTVLSVAKDFTPEVFAQGVERHCDEGPQFWVKTPIRYLRLRCEWARDKPPPAPQPNRPSGRPKGKTYAELDAEDAARAAAGGAP